MVLEQSDLKATIATLREENSALHASNAELEVRGAPAVVTHHGLYPIHMCIMDMLGAPVLGQTALRGAPYVEPHLGYCVPCWSGELTGRRGSCVRRQGEAASVADRAAGRRQPTRRVLFTAVIVASW